MQLNGTALHLFSLGGAAIITVATFFGVALLMLTDPRADRPVAPPAMHHAAPIPSQPTTATWPATPTSTNSLAASLEATSTSPKPSAPSLVATSTPPKPTTAPLVATSTPPTPAAPLVATPTKPIAAPPVATSTSTKPTAEGQETASNRWTSPSTTLFNAFEQYRESRIQYLRKQQIRIEMQLNESGLSATERQRLMQERTYWDTALEKVIATP